MGITRNNCKDCGKKVKNYYAKRCRKCSLKFRIGINHPNWKGGKYKGRDYILVYSPTHPYINKKGYVPEHRLIMEKKIGRYLLPEEIVHHINGIKIDNRIENLMLFKNISEHKRFHDNAYNFLVKKNLIKEYIKNIVKDNKCLI